MHPDLAEQLRSLGIDPNIALPSAAQAEADGEAATLFAGSEPAPAEPVVPVVPVVSPSADAKAVGLEGVPSVAELAARLEAIELVLRRQGWL